VKPRASKDAIEGEGSGALIVRLTAPPVEGEANEALARVLGRALGVAASSVRILSGATGRHKRVLVVGLDQAKVLSRLEGVGPSLRDGHRRLPRP
jgi:uncharacterized protein